MMAAAAAAAVDPPVPELTTPVTDLAGLIDPEKERQIERLSRALQTATGDVVVVVTVPTIEPFADIREYAAKLFENHGRGIGERGKDNGLLILLADKERRVWIEVGYGLEPIITDGFAGETSRDDMVPSFSRGDYGGGLLNGVGRIVVANRRGPERDADRRRGAARARAAGRADSAVGRPAGLHPHRAVQPEDAVGLARGRRHGAAVAAGAAGRAASGPSAAGGRWAAVEVADSAAGSAAGSAVWRRPKRRGRRRRQLVAGTLLHSGSERGPHEPNDRLAALWQSRRRRSAGCSYNRFVTEEEAIKAQWAQVQNQLQRRNDLIPNLVETVKGYAGHEEGVFKAIADARSQLLAARSPQETIEAANRQTSALGRLLAVVENYPQLKANEQFNRLMDELSGTENRIAVERMRYNERVQQYNTSTRRFPANLTAMLFGFERYPFFEAPPDARQVPKVNFTQP